LQGGLKLASIAASHAGSTAAESWPRGHWLAAAVLLLLVLATRGIWYGNPVADFDEQLYSFIGWRMQYGELPFVDWWDRKPFGLFAIFGLTHWAFGPSTLAYQLVATAFTLATAWLTYDCARLLVGRFSATMAAAITVMLLCAYSSYSAQSEVFFAPLMLGMLRLLAEPEHKHFNQRALLAMLLGGLALQVKYTVLPQCLFFGVYALWVQHRHKADLPALAKSAATYVALGLLPTVLIAIYYTTIGHWDAFIFANFLSFFDRIPSVQGRWGSDHGLAVMPLAILAAGGIYAAFRIQSPRNWQIWLFYCGWALASLASVLLPATVYLYYYAAMAMPAALVAVPLLDRTGPARGTIGLLLVMACFSLLSIPDRRAQSQAETAAGAQLASAIAPYVGEQTDCLWLFDGPTVLYRLTNSCVPTKFVYPDHLNNALEANALGVDQAREVSRILATKPGAIVTASRAVTPQNPQSTKLVNGALAKSYKPIATAEMHDRTITAWARISP